MKRQLLVITAGCALAAVGLAQEKKAPKHEVQEDVVFFTAATPAIAGAPGGRMMATQFFYGQSNKKGAPYAAEATTESTQILADGNRIVNKSTSKMYRDSEGRTRMETSLTPVGNWVPDQQSALITIHDPIAGEHFTLNSANKSAFKDKMPVVAKMRSAAPPPDNEAKETRVEVSKSVAVVGGTAGAVAVGQGAGTMVWAHSAAETLPMRVPHTVADNVKSESLGKQMIEGVECEGVRETLSIPAGAMGNERAILITTERWNSPELGIEVLRKHSDPRTGENTYRVTSLLRGEQPRSLFEVPPDYKMEEPQKGMRFERKIESKDNI